ncbi:MAG: hypothetical protein NTW21_27235 [Verrucomicrobia bacterium]|nr:hypothetical protein [Verrucomicrobiota bacterium]
MNSPRQPAPQVSPCAKGGFALIVTLSLMILLTILAVGLLTVSSISLRSAGQSGAMATAKCNARLALLLALGELQKQAGPDTRVTARADVLDEKNPPVLGVWKSWEGTDHVTGGLTAGRPLSPGDYAAKKRARFLAWLVSGSTASTVPDTTAAAAKVTLVGAGSVGDGEERLKLQIHLAPSLVTANGQNGAYAWWVGGENQKARLPHPYNPPSDSAARWTVHAKSHAVADPAPFRMDALLKDATPAAKAVTLPQGDLIATQGKLPASSEFFHDLSAVSVGLLTNTATGGWRKDLSLLTEKWDEQPSSNLPLFRVTPSQDLNFTRPTTGNPVAGRSMLYPWAAYRGGAADPPIYRHGPVTSWENLKDYATAYKRISASSSGRATIPTQSTGIMDIPNTFQFLHKVRILPVMARIQCLFSHSAGNPPPPAAGQPANPPGSLEPRLLMTPIITLWNPYNVEITTPALSFGVSNTPEAFRYTIDGRANKNYNSLRNNGLNNQPSLSTAVASSYAIAAGITLAPGETRVFSPTSPTPVPADTLINLTPGYRSGGGHYFPVLDDSGKPLVLSGSSNIRADAKFDTQYDDRGAGIGVYIDMSVTGIWALAYRMVYTPAVANVIYKPLTQLAEGTLSQGLTNPTPFLSTMFGARMASNTHLPAKGLVQSSPLVNYTAMGGKDVAESTIARHYGGTGHPVNCPFDYSFIKHTAGGDSYLPNADPTDHGYIVTGFQSSNGLSSCVINELPTRPLQSLGELQNWDLRYENPIPPFALNLIGNSDASPLLPASSVINAADSSLSDNLQHDDSYCANHLLFDDWFFSSIAPNPNDYGTSGKNLQEAFTEFISGDTALGNHSYQPLAADLIFASVNSANATQLYTNYVKPADSWKSIASRLEVEGMFNVNSTSVTAWRALVGHARSQKVPFIRDTGTSWGVDSSQETDYAVSRFSTAGDTAAGSSGRSGLFSDATQFAGYRVLDGKLLDAFALEIVKQIRTRGPFLSLSEFVNRQLSSGNLALTGTIQAALNELSKRPGTNPTAAIDSYLSANHVPDASAVPAMANLAEYRFPDAAAGKSVYGLPGWTRQADVLRPLAPILSARDDTFKIRSYGDARDGRGNIIARAVAEVTVRRTRDYVDPRDLPELSTPPAKTVNKTLGRRFQIISFKWLAAGEV